VLGHIAMCKQIKTKVHMTVKINLLPLTYK